MNPDAQTFSTSGPWAPPRPVSLRIGDPNANPGALAVSTLAAGAVPALVLSIVIARYGFVGLGVHGLAAVVLYLNFVIILRDLRYGLATFILAAGLSPKLLGFYNNLRMEDFVFVLVFGIWLLKGLLQGRIPLVRSPILLPYLLLTLMGVLSTCWGAHLGLIPDLKYSLFLQAKRIEYFLIFWVVATTVRSEGWLRLLLVCFVASGALAALYGLATAGSDPNLTVADTRVSGTEGANYNTFAGYLVLCIGAGLAALAGFRGPTRLLMGACTAIAGLGLLLSYSREGYVMLMGTLLVFGLTRHRWILLGAGLALVAALLVADPVRQNLNNTVQMIQTSRGDDVGGNSLTARYRAWRYRWDGWFVKQPLIGSGVGSVELSVDNEYLLRGCEVGVAGFLLFVWWLAAIWRQAKWLRTASGLPQVLGVGLTAGFVGMLIQGTVAASFTTIRTMEPFWFLLGLACVSIMLTYRLR